MPVSKHLSFVPLKRKIVVYEFLQGMGNMRAALNLTVPLLTDFGQGSEDAQTSQQACRNTSLSFQVSGKLTDLCTYVEYYQKCRNYF